MNDQYISLIAKYLSNDIEEQERAMLFELINSSEEHKAYFEEMQNLWAFSGEEETIEVDTNAAWDKVSKRITPTITKGIENPPAKIFRMGQLLKIAAVLIGVVAAFLTYRSMDSGEQQLVAFQTLEKEKKEIKLPDGSVVWLNENSKLSYNENFDPRVIRLEGEAFFDVQHLDKEHTFEILSGETKTTVLGTSFNVRAYPEEAQVEVTVETGKVAFENNKIKTANKKVYLTVGQSGVYKKKEEKIIKETEVISNAKAWKTQVLEFKNDPSLAEVIEVMERYFDIEIETTNPKILDCPFSDTEYKNPSLETMIQVFEFSLGIEIEQKENVLTLSGEGC